MQNRLGFLFPLIDMIAYVFNIVSHKIICFGTHLRMIFPSLTNIKTVLEFLKS